MDFMTCDTWSENEKLESNTTPSFLRENVMHYGMEVCKLIAFLEPGNKYMWILSVNSIVVLWRIRYYILLISKVTIGG